ncbi:MAG: hypothetical protein ACRDTX_31455 [Pseudonocardiaceae bacterium]
MKRVSGVDREPVQGGGRGMGPLVPQTAVRHGSGGLASHQVGEPVRIGQPCRFEHPASRVDLICRQDRVSQQRVPLDDFLRMQRGGGEDVVDVVAQTSFSARSVCAVTSTRLP